MGAIDIWSPHNIESPSCFLLQAQSLQLGLFLNKETLTWGSWPGLCMWGETWRLERRTKPNRREERGRKKMVHARQSEQKQKPQSFFWPKTLILLMGRRCTGARSHSHSSACAATSRPEEGQSLRSPDSLCRTNKVSWSEKEGYNQGEDHWCLHISPWMSESVWSIANVERPVFTQ